MLSDKQILEALHASRVFPVEVPNPHGPLGLEQLAETVSRATTEIRTSFARVERPLNLSLETWEKLDGLARSATKVGSRRVSASDVAAALIEQAITTQ